jgi:hypothetical protein
LTKKKYVLYLNTKEIIHNQSKSADKAKPSVNWGRKAAGLFKDDEDSRAAQAGRPGIFFSKAVDRSAAKLPREIRKEGGVS